MRKTIILIILACIVASGIVFGIMILSSDFDRPDYAGGYESIDNEISVYDMYLEKDGTFEIIDAGAGNPAIKGKMTKFPIGKNTYLLNCIHDEDFDPYYMNTRFRLSFCNVYFTKEKSGEYKGRKVITIKNGKEMMEFW